MISYILAVLMLLLSGKGSSLQPRPLPDEREIPGIDVEFAKSLLASNLADMDTARIAVGRASNDEVRKFALSVLDEHTITNDRIRQIAARKGITLPFASGRGAGASGADELSVAPGMDFDHLFINEQFRSQRERLKLCRREIVSGVDPDLRSLASDSLYRLGHQAAFLADLSEAGSLTTPPDQNKDPATLSYSDSAGGSAIHAGANDFAGGIPRDHRDHYAGAAGGILPKTASDLPLLAVAGCLFALMSIALRLACRIYRDHALMISAKYKD